MFLSLHTALPRNNKGHNYVGHNHIGRNYMGRNYVPLVTHGPATQGGTYHIWYVQKHVQMHGVRMRVDMCSETSGNRNKRHGMSTCEPA